MFLRRGFTLIELLVVVSIVSLVSSVTMYSTASARAKASDANKKSQVHQVETAISIKKSATGKVPRNYNCGGNYCAGGTGDSIALEGTQAFNASMQELVSGGYISAIPDSKDDSYVYYADSSADQSAFGASLVTVQAQASKNSCAIMPVQQPYTTCISSYTTSTPYTDPNAVYFSYPMGTVSFCTTYGRPECGGGNGMYGSVCPWKFTGPSGPCFVEPGFISCIPNPAAVSVCSGSGNDYCACS